MTLVEASREPLREIVTTPERMEECCAALAAASGPVGFDTERAHGHRYWPKAYLLQIRRQGAGTWLIDPIAFERGGPANLTCLVTACGEATWIIHAASQDLPCMREIGIVPPRIFDSELAARLLGKSGASLGWLLESEFGIQLRKAHSADNWSRRPLPASWLTYAALDVDYLPELAQSLADQLVATGRHEWAEQEFADILGRFSAAPEPKVDQWRRLRGLSTLKSPRQFAVARELWQARDAIACRQDRPPSWILPDDAIIAVAQRSRPAIPRNDEVTSMAAFAKPPGQRHLRTWLGAIDRVRSMQDGDYPPLRPRTTGVPHPRTWDRINPEAAKRWAKVKPAIEELACSLGGLQASLVAPPTVLHNALFVSHRVDRESLLALGARPWQADFLEPLIAQALAS